MHWNPTVVYLCTSNVHWDIKNVKCRYTLHVHLPAISQDWPEGIIYKIRIFLRNGKLGGRYCTHCIPAHILDIITFWSVGVRSLERSPLLRMKGIQLCVALRPLHCFPSSLGSLDTRSAWNCIVAPLTWIGPSADSWTTGCLGATLQGKLHCKFNLWPLLLRSNLISH